MITRTDAVVLKSMKYRDSSKIVTFYSRRFGKIKGIAKGARQMKSKFGAALEPLSAVSLILYKKDQRELQLISQCDLLKTYKNIHSELDRLAVGLSIIELLNQLTHDEEGNDALYTLVVQSLDELERAQKHFMNFFLAFELRCASVLGFMPSLDACKGCGRKLDDLVSEDSAVFQSGKGAILCSRCWEPKTVLRNGASRLGRTGASGTYSDEGNIRVSIGVLKALQRLLNAPLESIGSLDLGSALGNEIDGTLRLYMRQHFEDLKPIRSFDMLKKLTGPSA
ncbi:MAG: DNA repair protein RecO [Ignavibacteriales bacterium]|nr:DNA repair protein RecO [Ignavibacteriales bacterium]